MRSSWTAAPPPILSSESDDRICKVLNSRPLKESDLSLLTLYTPSPEDTATSPSSAASTSTATTKYIITPTHAGVSLVSRPPLTFFLTSGPNADELPVTTKASVPYGAMAGDFFGTLLPTGSIFSASPPLSSLELIDSALTTGITAIDVLTPIGKGQNMLMIKPKSYASMLPVVAATATSNGIEVFTSSDSEDPVTAYIDARKQLHLAHVHASSGGDALVILPSVAPLHEFFAMTSSIIEELRSSDGKIHSDVSNSIEQSASNSEMRAFYSDVLQQAAALNVDAGGGSVTVLLGVDYEDSVDETYSMSDFSEYPQSIIDRLQVLADRGIAITTSTLGKLQIPPPPKDSSGVTPRLIDDLISMSDGQVTLTPDTDFSPPLNVMRSITRVGIGHDTSSRADSKAIRRAGGTGVRVTLAMERGGGMDGRALREVRCFKAAVSQGGNKPRRLCESVVRLMSVPFLVDAGEGMEGEDFVDLITNMDRICHSVVNEMGEEMKAIDKDEDFDDETEALIKGKIQKHIAS